MLFPTLAGTWAPQSPLMLPWQVIATLCLRPTSGKLQGGRRHCQRAWESVYLPGPLPKNMNLGKANAQLTLGHVLESQASSHSPEAPAHPGLGGLKVRICFFLVRKWAGSSLEELVCEWAPRRKENVGEEKRNGPKKEPAAGSRQQVQGAVGTWGAWKRSEQGLGRNWGCSQGLQASLLVLHRQPRLHWPWYLALDLLPFLASSLPPPPRRLGSQENVHLWYLVPCPT